MTKLLGFILDQGEQFRRARLPSLYSDFSLQRYTNPDGYAANVVAWEVALIKAAGHGLIPAGPDGSDFLCLRTGEELLQSLETTEWGRPLALGTVIDEAVSQQHLIPVNYFLNLTSSIYRQSWLTRPWWFYFRGLRQFDRASASKELRNERYVIVKNVEVVKLTLSQGVTCPISSEDYAIASLKSLISDLNLQVGLLTSQISTLATKTQSSVKNQNRSLALHTLRSKKMAESILVQRLEALSTLEGIYGKIEQASDQIAFVQAVRKSTGILRNLNAEVGKMEKVEDMVEELRSEMNMVEDVGRAMEGAGHDAAIDDDAIDKELEALVQDFQSEEEKQGVQETQKRLASINDSSTAAVDGGLQSQNVQKAGNTSPIRLGDPENSLVAESTRAFGRMSMDERKVASLEQG